MQQKTIKKRLASIQHLREGHLKVVIPYKGDNYVKTWK